MIRTKSTTSGSTIGTVLFTNEIHMANKYLTNRNEYMTYAQLPKEHNVVQ